MNNSYQQSNQPIDKPIGYNDDLTILLGFV